MKVFSIYEKDESHRIGYYPIKFERITALVAANSEQEAIDCYVKEFVEHHTFGWKEKEITKFKTPLIAYPCQNLSFDSEKPTFLFNLKKSIILQCDGNRTLNTIQEYKQEIIGEYKWL